MVGAMGTGYPLTQSWGYNNYSSYLGYNTGAGGLATAYSQPIGSYTSPTLDPTLAALPGSTPQPPTSPPGEPMVYYQPSESD